MKYFIENKPQRKIFGNSKLYDETTLAVIKEASGPTA